MKLTVEADAKEAIAGYLEEIKKLILEGFTSSIYPTYWNLEEAEG